jgi:hypothetical protein
MKNATIREKYGSTGTPLHCFRKKKEQPWKSKQLLKTKATECSIKTNSKYNQKRTYSAAIYYI